jgi:hypothetical protein
MEENSISEAGSRAESARAKMPRRRAARRHIFRVVDDFNLPRQSAPILPDRGASSMRIEGIRNLGAADKSSIFKLTDVADENEPAP